MSEPRVKYPRTPHLPGSGGATADDVHIRGDFLAGVADVVVTEKLDGEGVTFLRDGMHARSVDSRHHPSRDWARALHATVAGDIPSGMRVCGEYLYATHSIAYANLSSYFYVFNIWCGEVALAWDETVEWAELLGLETVPVLYRGPMRPVPELHRLWAQRLGPEVSEGFVVRDAGAFSRGEFADRVAKMVRPGHVQTDTHWMHGPVVPNRLAPGHR